MSFKVNSLKVNNQYEFRIRYKINGNGPEYSDWSSILSVSTETEPLNGDALYKAISMHGKDQLKKLLSVLYVMFRKENDEVFDNSFACLGDQIIDCLNNQIEKEISH